MSSSDPSDAPGHDGPASTDSTTRARTPHGDAEARRLLALALDGGPKCGTVLGGYEIIAEIGRGGMGVVYAARQVGLDRIVALKLLVSSPAGGAEELHRFQREAQAAAALDHPGIVTIHDVGEVEGRSYLSMDFVQGGSLADRLREGPLDARHAAQLVQSLAEAVQHAHDRGLLHRDIKPSNVMLDELGRPRLTDFGLARPIAAGACETLTRTDVVVGTPSFMPPEQGIPGGRALGPAADVYSLGATAYACLTGRPPFEAASVVEVLRQVAEEAPIPPRALDGTIPRDLEACVLACLEKDPKRRPADARALADDLGRFLRGEPVRARPSGPVVRGWAWCRRHPLTATLAALTAASLVIATIVASVGAARVEVEARQAREQLARAERAEAEARTQLVAALSARARAELQGEHAGRRAAALESIARAAAIAPSLDLRRDAIAALCTTDVHAGPRHAAPANAKAVMTASDLGLIAWAAPDGEVVVSRMGDGAVVARGASEVGPAWWIDFAPDGSVTCTLHARRGNEPGELVAWPLRAPAARWSVATHGRPGFAAGGRLVAAGDPAGGLVVRDVNDGRAVARWSAAEVANAAALSADGGIAALSSLESRRVIVHDLRSGVRHAIRLDAAPRQLAFTPDGRQLAVACADGVRILRIAGGLEEDLFFPTPSIQASVAADPAGLLLASYSWDENVWLFDLHARALVSRGSATAPNLRFSADGRWLDAAWKQGCAQPWHVDRGDGIRKLLADEHSGDPRVLSYGLDFLPGSGHVATANETGVSVWDPATGRIVAQVALHAARSVFGEPDGMLISAISGVWRWQPPRRPELLHAGDDVERIGLDASGDVIAIAERGTGRALVTRAGAPPVRAATEHRGLAFVALDPAASLVATGTWQGSGVLVHSATTGELVARLEMPETAVVEFSPDGRLLVAGGSSGHRAWRVGSWDVAWQRRGEHRGRLWRPTAFSPDGSLLALSVGPDSVELVEATTGALLAQLEAPMGPAGSWLRFSRDGTRLGLALDARRLAVWDVARLRDELRALGLDWH